MSQNREVAVPTPYTLMVVFCITIQLLCNSIEGKLILLPFNLYLPASALIYPITFAMADVMTEVYGYKAAVRVVWLNVFSQLIFCTLIPIFVHMPSPSFWHNQQHYDAVFDFLIREDLGSIISLLISKCTNDFLVSYFKVRLAGRGFIARVILASCVGEMLLVVVDYLITFTGKLPLKVITVAILSSWATKCIFAVLYAYPAKWLSNYLKRVEHIDVYDTDVSYNPFQIAVAADYVRYN